MKLEVGQKIGIYEVVKDDVFSLPIGSQHLGNRITSRYYLIYPCLIYRSDEVRKVGSLTVKKLKRWKTNQVKYSSK